jgi:hypothetical protein
MRPNLRTLAPALLAACALTACNSTPGNSGSGSGGPPDSGSTPTGGIDAGSTGGGSDAGAGGGATDAGTAGGGSDAGGSTGGGAADAGSGGGTGGGTADAGSGGGTADAGTDGGTTASDCTGLTPGALPAMMTYQTNYSTSSEAGFCGLPMGDGMGSVALETRPSGHPTWVVLDSTARQTGSFGAWQGNYFPNPAGYVGYSGSSTQQMVAVNGFNSTGTVNTGNTPVNGFATFASDPRGGLLAVGFFTYSTDPRPPPPHQMVMMFNANGTIRWGPDVLQSDAQVFGAGVDMQGHSLIILDGGSGNIDALWLDENGGSPHSGTPTPPFRLITGFHAGASTWFETSPLIGGGLAVRRMDAGTTTSDDERRTSQWLGVLASESNSMSSPPDWLASRPNTNMRLVMSGRAYAFSPWAADAAVCDQSVEVVSPTGNSCGRQDFGVDGSACRTRELRLGLDGTVMQMLPADREQFVSGSAVVKTCTLRFWPAVLR